MSVWAKIMVWIAFGVTAASAAMLAKSPTLAKEHLRAVLFAGELRPAPGGEYAVGRSRLTVNAGENWGPVGVDLWYPVEGEASPGTWLRLRERLLRPTQASAIEGASIAFGGRPHPVIISIPSWFSTRDENTFAFADLASHGFVVIAVDDIVRYTEQSGERGVVQRSALDMTSEEGFTASRILSGRRVKLASEFASAVLDGIGALPEWQDRLDLKRVGALGCSFGGSAVAQMSRDDARIAGLINLDGSLFGEAERDGIAVPYIQLFANDSIPTSADLKQPDLSIRFEAILTEEALVYHRSRAGASEVWSFVVPDTTHIDFSDRLVMPAFSRLRHRGPLDRPGTARALHDLYVAFFLRVLRQTSGSDPAKIAQLPHFLPSTAIPPVEKRRRTGDLGPSHGS